MVEQSAVNRRVTSSNLVSGAIYEKPAIPKREAGFFVGSKEGLPDRVF